MSVEGDALELALRQLILERETRGVLKDTDIIYLDRTRYETLKEVFQDLAGVAFNDCYVGHADGFGVDLSNLRFTFRGYAVRVSPPCFYDYLLMVPAEMELQWH